MTSIAGKILARYVAMCLFRMMHIREFPVLSLANFLLLATALGITIALAAMSYK